MLDPRMLEVLALTALLLLVVVIGGLVLQFGWPANLGQIAQLWSQPSPSPLVAQRTTEEITSFGIRTKDVAPAFPPVVIPSPTVSVFAPILQPAVEVAPTPGFLDQVGAMITPGCDYAPAIVCGSSNQNGAPAVY